MTGAPALTRRAVLAAAVSAPGLAHAEVRLQDGRSRAHVLPRPAERLITLPIPMASMVMAIDQGSRRVVGMHPSSQQSLREGFLRRIFPEALKIRADVTRGAEFVPNIESVLSLRPDAVLQWTEPAASIRMLDDARLRAVGLYGSPADQDIHERNLRIVGQLIGRGARTEALIGRQRQAIAQVATAVRGAKPVRALYLSRAKSNMVPGQRASYQSYWIRLAGGRNVAADHRANGPINSEQLIVWNPEVIFVGAFDSATPKNLYGEPALASVAAVRNRRVYKLPHGGYRWDPASQESHLTTMWAANLMQPERARFDLRRETRQTFDFLYGYRLSDSDVDDILAVRENGGSRGYERMRRV